MKLICILLFFFSVCSYADSATYIFCTDDETISSIVVNTNDGKIFYNGKYEVAGPVYSGVNSNTNYNGEILGEITIGHESYYITLIFSNSQNNITLKTHWYPKSNSTKSYTSNFDQCRIDKLNSPL